MWILSILYLPQIPGNHIPGNEPTTHKRVKTHHSDREKEEDQRETVEPRYLSRERPASMALIQMGRRCSLYRTAGWNLDSIMEALLSQRA
jgi:hypothetical protein